MKILVQIVFLFSIALSGHGQYERDHYKVDSLQIFSGDKLTYEFNLQGPSQGLFFNRYVYSQLPGIELKIYNNTRDTISASYREKDAHLMWIRVGGSRGKCDTMAPNDYFILKSGWASWGYHPVGGFRTSIEIQTQIGDSISNCVIRTWGELYPEDYTFNKDKLEQNVPDNIDTIRSKEIHVYDIAKDTISGLHYWSHAGKEKINPSKVKYYTPRLVSDGYNWIGERGRKYLDSLNTLVAPFGASIKWAEADGMIITCNSKDSQIISRILGKRNLYIMLSRQEWLEDRYRIEFKNDLSKEEITTVLNRLNLEPNLIDGSKVAFVTLSNSPKDNNNSITDQLAKMKEIQSIRQMTINVVLPDN